MNKNRCWIALKYTSSKAFLITLVMKDVNDEFIIIIKEKEMIFRKMAFSDPIMSFINIPISRDFFINAISSFIIKQDIEKALFK
jgi:hypothetical protein